MTIKFNEAATKKNGYSLDATLDILQNGDQFILGVGIISIPFSIIEQEIGMRDDIDISEELKSKGLELIIRLYFDKYSAQAIFSAKSMIDDDYVNQGFGIVEEIKGENYYDRNEMKEQSKCLKKILN